MPRRWRIGWGGVYGVTKVIGEDLCRMYHEMTGASVAMLRYHDFVPKPYLAFGAKLLRNGVDRRDVADATVAALQAAVEKRYRTVSHHRAYQSRVPEAVRADFRRHGPDWCETQVPGAAQLLTAVRHFPARKRGAARPFGSERR